MNAPTTFDPNERAFYLALRRIVDRKIAEKKAAERRAAAESQRVAEKAA